MKGFDNVSMVDIAHECRLDEDIVYRYFGNKNDIILFLYQCINADWQQQVDSLPTGKLEERFRIATELKISLMEPYQFFLSNIIGSLLQSKSISIQAAQTAHIRAMGLMTIQKIIDGSDDAKALKKRIKDLPSLLFMMHWGVMFLHLQSFDRAKTADTLFMMSKMIARLNKYSFLLNFSPFINEISAWANKITLATDSNFKQTNRDILKILFNHRKLLASDMSCQIKSCEQCFEMHELNIDYFTSQSLPIHLILPAFPAKSPNSNKVLGKLPDLGEEIALHTLNNLCNEINGIYAPGAQITICSDGRIFSNLVVVNDDDITQYVNDIREIIKSEKLHNIEILNLEDLMSGDSFDELRNRVLSVYADSYEDLSDRLKSDEGFKKLFNGMHKFIIEDRTFLFAGISKTKIKEESKEITLKLIQHSNAWTRFLNYVYPKSIRLSIHPYHAHSEKIGVKITKAIDNWLTPWHGVIVLQEDGYMLMKKYEAEEINARLIYKKNRPYYYTTITE